ncbi:Pre-mRNA-splicing factor SPF27 [Piptocephalis cylindrospora]|uniref:Pre-mRNA-splicing factor SPF27 n=1 Tax=Piptocephalis cylindrospora TaxID=1907219 RepID=A0A4P9XZT6_9FUNG|nr:Pre-mRNA-splicing factor SPF27 [Piptocephalis cylindrospora]|eukprot:RKP11904.1 Pre-mRNA-splicing factor SPF27 [Piptocephalis cylindrospora]
MNALKDNQDIILDALPYVDKEVDAPGMRDLAEGLIEEELARKKAPSTADSELPKAISLFESNPFLKDAYERTVTVKANDTDAGVDFSRYTLAEPSKEDGPEKWESAVDMAKATLEHQRLRMCNLELMQRYGTMMWKGHTSQLDVGVKGMEREVKTIKKEDLGRINKERKRYQLEMGESLQSLDQQWKGLISSNLQTQLACMTLASELADWERYEGELRAEAAAANVDISDVL